MTQLMIGYLVFSMIAIPVVFLVEFITETMQVVIINTICKLLVLVLCYFIGGLVTYLMGV